jgi:SAM-dependent methyltransferase
MCPIMTHVSETHTNDGWTFKTFTPGTLWLQKFTLSRIVKSFATYQPIILDGRELRRGSRACADRWRLIERVIAESDSESVLDLGCAEGYFVREAAKRKRVALGVDGDLRAITIGQTLASLERISGAAFMHAVITPKLVRQLPQFDSVIFLSILHHVFNELGAEDAREMMEAIRTRTRKRLIFDMGQSNETTYPWAKILPPMEPDPGTWISHFLRQCGFSAVEVVGESEGYNQAHARLLFAATP